MGERGGGEGWGKGVGERGGGEGWRRGVGERGGGEGWGETGEMGGREGLGVEGWGRGVETGDIERGEGVRRCGERVGGRGAKKRGVGAYQVQSMAVRSR